MKKKRLLSLVAIMGLTVALVALLVPACAPAAPEGVAEEIAALETEIEDLEDEVAAKDREVSDLEKEIAALKKPAVVYDWNFQAHNPPGSSEWLIYEDFQRRVEGVSGGRIQLTLHPGGTLCPPDKTFESAAKGMFEIGWSDPAYHKGFMPFCEVGTAPFMLRTLSDALEVYHYTNIKEVWGEPYLEHGVKLLGLTSICEIPLICSKPVYRVSDFVGMKIRTIGGRATMLDELGAATTYIPGDEVYAALASGLVEGATWGGEGSFVPKGWHEVCKYIIYPALTAYPVGCNDIFMSADLYNSLPEDIQNILIECALPMFEAYSYIMQHENTVQRAVLDDAGVERIYLPPEDFPAMAEAASVVWDQIAEKGPVAREVVKIITDYMRLMGYTDYKL